MVADSTPSDVALANPIIWPIRASRLCKHRRAGQKVGRYKQAQCDHPCRF
jgi:hypothetical protein